jgi:hypothetical protein
MPSRSAVRAVPDSRIRLEEALCRVHPLGVRPSPDVGCCFCLKRTMTRCVSPSAPREACEPPWRSRPTSRTRTGTSTIGARSAMATGGRRRSGRTAFGLSRIARRATPRSRPQAVAATRRGLADHHWCVRLGAALALLPSKQSCYEPARLWRPALRREAKGTSGLEGAPVETVLASEPEERRERSEGERGDARLLVEQFGAVGRDSEGAQPTL